MRISEDVQVQVTQLREREAVLQRDLDAIEALAEIGGMTRADEIARTMPVIMELDAVRAEMVQLTRVA